MRLCDACATIQVSNNSAEACEDEEEDDLIEFSCTQITNPALVEEFLRNGSHLPIFALSQPLALEKFQVPPQGSFLAPQFYTQQT